MNFWGWAMICNLFKKFGARLRSKTPYGNLSYLVLDSFHVFRMTVPKAVHPNPSDDIDISIAVDISQGAALAFFDHYSSHRSETLQAGREVLFFFLPHLLALRPGNLSFYRHFFNFLGFAHLLHNN